MSVTEMLQAVQFVVDADGNKKAVVFDYGIWEELLTLLEEKQQENLQARVIMSCTWRIE